MLQQERGMNQTPAPTITPNFRAMVEEDNIDPLALFAKAKEQREKEGMAKKPEIVVNDKKLEVVLRDDSPEYKIPQVLSQDIIIRQPDVMKYKEVEYNIFVNSSDRDWINNFNENRYNFTVNFNRPASADEPSFTPSVQQRFKNVQRVETVKVIMSLESLPIKSNTGINQNGSHEIDTIVQVAAGPVYSSSPSVSAYAYQYIAMRIAELNTNGFGTNTRLDNSFAILHKDTDWVSDSSTASANKGYASMSPKYLKCQKIYSPTLGSLDRLSIRLERPDGQLLSDTSDVLTIQQFVLSGNLDVFTGGTNTTLYKGPPATVGQLNTTPASGTQTQNEYIFIQTTGYFSKWQLNYPDRIIIKNAAVSGTQTGAVADFLKFVNREEGHAVVGLAYNISAAVVADGQNTNGFANWIIIRSEFNDPQLSSSYFYNGGAQYLSRNYYGNTAANELTFGQTLYNASSSQVTLNSGAALINMNHQTHVVLRVVCREMDGSSSIRPDNI
jgi:predicted RNA-binding protein